MKFNRDLTILLLLSLQNKNMQICLPLAGTGVRGIRMLQELPEHKIKNILFNDIKLKKLEENLKINNIADFDKVTLSGKDANLLFLESFGFDYIDIDPFGSPIPFLDMAIKKLSRGGILGVTATDTAALAGTSVKACKRKYNAISLKNAFMHETGIRILVKKVQEIGASHDRALTPIFSFFKDHYYRVFFRCEKGKKKADKILKKHSFLLYNSVTLETKISSCNYSSSHDKVSGPLWIGKLWDNVLVKNMIKNCKDDKLKKFLFLIEDEMRNDVVGFYNIHELIKGKGFEPKPMLEIVSKEVTRTHFLGQGVKTKLHPKELLKKIVKT